MSAAEKLIHERQLTKEQANELQQAHLRTIKEYAVAPAGWHGSDDIETLIGLEGSFLWTEDPFSPANIRFKFDTGHVGSQGTYAISKGESTIEQGTFHCAPNNPAIGWAYISLIPQNSATPRAFVVTGMMTNNEWSIIVMLLNKADQLGQMPFPVIRSGPV